MKVFSRSLPPHRDFFFRLRSLAASEAANQQHHRLIKKLPQVREARASRAGTQPGGHWSRASQRNPAPCRPRFPIKTLTGRFSFARRTVGFLRLYEHVHVIIDAHVGTHFGRNVVNRSRTNPERRVGSRKGSSSPRNNADNGIDTDRRRRRTRCLCATELLSEYKWPTRSQGVARLAKKKIVRCKNIADNDCGARKI